MNYRNLIRLTNIFIGHLVKGLVLKVPYFEETDGYFWHTMKYSKSPHQEEF